MNRDKVAEIMQAFGRPAFANEKGEVVLTFSRQSMKDVEEIEAMDIDKLQEEWKDLFIGNCIQGGVSMSDLQRMALLQLEIECRPNGEATNDELDAWAEAEIQKAEEAEGAEEDEDFP